MQETSGTGKGLIGYSGTSMLAQLKSTYLSDPRSAEGKHVSSVFSELF